MHGNKDSPAINVPIIKITCIIPLILESSFLNISHYIFHFHSQVWAYVQSW